MSRHSLRLLAFALPMVLHACAAHAGPFAPAAGQPGSDAIAAASPGIIEWANSVAQLTRGPEDISNPSLGNASAGTGANALGPASTDPAKSVSLGDGGSITLSFAEPITDGPGFDFAVFENSFSDTFLELGFVEVSSDGTNFFRFPSISLTQTATQVASFGTLDPTNLYDLAGKYRAGFGTPFNLSELAGVSPLLNIHHITQVRVVDVVGSINPLYATHDSQGHIVNDPWPTPFASSGFDLEGVGVLRSVPEPATWLLLAIGVLGVTAARRFNRERCRN